MMNKRKIISCTGRSLFNSYANSSGHHPQVIHTTKMATCFSSVAPSNHTNTTISKQHQGIKHGSNPSVDDNRIDVPFAPNKTQPVSVESPNDNTESSSSFGDKTRDDKKSTTEYVTDKAKSGTKSAVETAFEVGAAMAEGMEHTWKGVKQTTHKVKDAVLGEDDGKDGGRDGKREHGGGHEADKHVEDLSRKAGGYDTGSH